MFTRDGIFYFHNVHIWAHVNPHAVREVSHQTTFSILGCYLWGSADWFSQFNKAIDGAYLQGVFGTTDERHLV